jgi:hypothetical protein
MFLAIINDTYSEVKAEVNARKEAFQVIIITINLVHLRVIATWVAYTYSQTCVQRPP